jgi:hypothetical protein
MRQTRISKAVAAGLAGLILSAAPFTGANAADISRSGTGQALLFPYYTTNGGWVTTFNVMNTENKSLAVRLRFHEYKNSRDVLDFVVVLSPYDAWTGWVQIGPDGIPVIRTEDKSCTSPQQVDGRKLQKTAYIDTFNDTGGDGYNRLREGYLEVLVMGEAVPPFAVPPTGFVETPGLSYYVPYFSEHVDGVPRNCGVVDRAFIATAPRWVSGTDPALYVSGNATAVPPVPAIVNSLAGSGDPSVRIDFVAPSSNPIKGNITWLLGTTGAGAGDEAVAVSDWATYNMITAQQFPWFLEPTFASTGGLWTVDDLAVNYEPAVAALSTFNEWASNPDNGASTDWVVTFPTKAFHVDHFNDQIQAAVSRYRNSLAEVVTCTTPTDRTTCVPAGTAPIDVEPFENLFGVSGNGDSPITVTYNFYDREEGSVEITTDGTTISPTPPSTVQVDTLPWEANVIQLSDLPILASRSPNVVNVSELLNGAVNGWGRVTFSEAFSAGTTPIPLGLPVAAFAVKVRDRGIPGASFGQAMPHGYELLP